ncbi:hypothetical protein [Pseudonocardia sp. NPDC049154]
MSWHGAKHAGLHRTLSTALLAVIEYFDNDVKVHAPFDAIALAERLTH